MHHFFHQAVSIPNPTFRLFEKGAVNGVDRLDPNLTINGTTNTPILRYKGGDANATNWVPWGYGPTLNLVAPIATGGSAPTYNDGSPLLGPNDDSVLFHWGGFYRSTETSLGSIGTNDFVIEAVLRKNHSSASNSAFTAMSKSTSQISQGWSFGYSANGRIFFNVTDASGSTNTLNLSNSAIEGEWIHCIIFGDRSGSLGCYVNGVAITGGVISTRALTLDNVIPLTIGAQNDGSQPYNCQIAYLAMWSRAGWLDTHLQVTVAKTRFYQLAGIYPQVAKGTQLPTIWGHAGIQSELDKIDESTGVRSLWVTSVNWPRICKRKDLNNSYVTGYLTEVAVANIALHGYCFSELAWTRLNAGDTFGTNLIADGDMELNNVTNWTAGNSATLTKDTTAPHGGTRNLRIARNGVNNPYASQPILTLKESYRITGWAKGDGTAIPRIIAHQTLASTMSAFDGLATASWQRIDVVARHVNNTNLSFSGYTSTGTTYVEFDDIQVFHLPQVAPLKDERAIQLVSDTTSGSHGVAQNITLTSAVYTFSVWAKAAQKSWLYLTAPQVTPLLVDGDMENASVIDFGGVGATLTKDTTSPHGGTRCLRVTSTSASFGLGSIGTTTGKSYNLQGWARSTGGTNFPQIKTSVATVWTGTTSTSWQSFDVTFTGNINLGLYTQSNNNATEYDDLILTENGNADGYFNLSTGVVGTKGANAIEQFIDNWGNGWYRCGISHAGSAKSFTHKIQFADADGDHTYAGDGTNADGYLWGPQVEASTFPTSLIQINGASSLQNRYADILQFAAQDGNIGGTGTGMQNTVVTDILYPNRNETATLYEAVIADTVGITDAISLYNAPATDQAALAINKTNVTQVDISTGGGDIVDGVKHTLRRMWKTNSAKQYVDGLVVGTPDTSCTIPNAATIIGVGCTTAVVGVRQPNGLLRNFKIFKQYTRKG